MNETGLLTPDALPAHGVPVGLSNPHLGFPSMASPSGNGGWLAGLGKIAGGLFSVVKDAGSRLATKVSREGSRLATGATRVVCTAGTFIAAHPVGVAAAAAATILGAAVYCGYKYIGELNKKPELQKHEPSPSQHGEQVSEAKDIEAGEAVLPPPPDPDKNACAFLWWLIAYGDIGTLSNAQKVELLRNAYAKDNKFLTTLLMEYDYCPRFCAYVANLLHAMDEQCGPMDATNCKIRENFIENSFQYLLPEDLFGPWKQTTFEFLRRFSPDNMANRLYELEKNNGMFSDENIRLLANEFPDKPTTFEQCGRWNVGRITSEEARDMLLGACGDNIADVVAICATREGSVLVALKDLVEKLSPGDAETFARTLAHGGNIGKTIAELLFSDGLQNLSKEKFTEISGEPPTKFLPNWHPAALRLNTHETREMVSREIDAFQTEFKATVDKITTSVLGETSISRAKISDSMEIWQRIANEVAVCCFDKDGKINIEDTFKLRMAIQRMVNSNSFPANWPSAGLMCSQMLCVMDHLLRPESDFRDFLESEKGSNLSERGRTLLEITSRGKIPTLTAAEAELASLFSLHRQLGLPTCANDSLINAETFNHPITLARIYSEILREDCIILPSARLVHQPEISGDETITVDLSGNERGISRIIKVVGGASEAVSRFAQDGIGYNPDEPGKLRFQVRNLTDVLFANLFQTTFGDSETEAAGDDHGTLFAYAGIPAITNSSNVFSPEINVNKLESEIFVETLKFYALQHKKHGLRYMRVKTSKQDGTGVHSEIFDVDAILSLDFSKGNPLVIGNRNWVLAPGNAVITVIQRYANGKIRIRDGIRAKDGTVKVPDDSIGGEIGKVCIFKASLEPRPQAS